MGNTCDYCSGVRNKDQVMRAYTEAKMINALQEAILQAKDEKIQTILKSFPHLANAQLRNDASNPICLAS